MTMLSARELVSTFRHLAHFVLVGTLLFQTACAGKVTIVRPEPYGPKSFSRPIRVEVTLRREVLLRWKPRFSGATITERRVRVSGIMSGWGDETIYIRATSPGLSGEYSVEVSIEDIEELKMMSKTDFEKSIEGVFWTVDRCCLSCLYGCLFWRHKPE